MNAFAIAKRTTAGTFASCLIPQNGVAERMYHGPGNNPTMVARASSLDTHNGNVATCDSPSRPKILEVNSISKNTSHPSFAAKVRDDMGNDDGSLPCTPELLSDSENDVSICSAGDEALKNATQQLIGGFYRDFTGLNKQQRPRNTALSTMKTVVGDLLEKHRYAYNGMIHKLDLDERGDDMSFIGSVAQNIFADGTTNWGRIASLVAFGAVVCQSLKEKRRDHCIELVGKEISEYLLSYQRDWLVKNNSWDGFVEFFRVADPESSVRNTLMAFAGVAGIGATLALLIR